VNIMNESFINAIKQDKSAFDAFEYRSLDKRHQNGLFYAIKYKAFNALKSLLNLGLNVNHQNNKGDTPLHYAAYFGDHSLCQMLIDSNASINIPNKKGITPLMYGAYKGSLEVVKLLALKQGDLNNPDKLGNTSLFYAVSSKKLKVLNYLIEQGANLYVKNYQDETLHHAIAKNGLLTMNDVLLNHRLPPDYKNIYKQTPLHFAAKNGNELLVESYLKYGLNPLMKDSFDKTPLMYAKPYGDVHTMIERSIYNLAVEKSYKTYTLHRALREENLDEAEALLKKSTHIDEKDYYGNKPLFYILKSKDLVLLKLFLERSKDFENIDYLNNHAYFLAALFDNNGFFEQVDIKKDAFDQSTKKLIKASKSLSRLLR